MSPSTPNSTTAQAGVADIATTNSSDLLVRREGGVVHITMNRPERRNALSLSVLQQLDALLSALAIDREARVIVIGSNGPVFCAGHDLSEMTERTRDDYHTIFSTCSRVMQKLRAVPQPVIARVHALATAAGCQLVAACDLVVAVDTAQFATPGVKIGLFCTTPMVPLVRSMAPKVAMEMLLTGAPITAERAYQAGLVNRVVPAAELDTAVGELCRAILATSPLTIRFGKQAFYDQMSLAEPVAYQQSVDIISDNAVTNDAREGIRAFLEKRRPEWTGT